jgi:hypothetical protein
MGHQWHQRDTHTLVSPQLETQNPPCCYCQCQDAYDWSQSKVIMDVGGGRGHLLSTVMSYGSSDCRGVLLDRQFVIDRWVLLKLQYENVT